jgi:hypothetical protein
MVVSRLCFDVQGQGSFWFHSSMHEARPEAEGRGQSAAILGRLGTAGHDSVLLLQAISI